MSRLSGEIKKIHISFFSNFLPLQIWTEEICNHDISKKRKYVGPQTELIEVDK